MNKLTILISVLLTSLVCGSLAPAEEQVGFRAPSVPLVTYNPFLSIWSGGDHLNDVPTRHWTGGGHRLISMIRIDGKSFRLMGGGRMPDPGEPHLGIPKFTQKSLKITPTRSIYEFEEAGVHVSLAFLQPLLPDDLDIFSWPLAYLTWSVRSVDGAVHQVELYDSASSRLAAKNPEEVVAWERQKAGDLTLLRVGTVEQPVFSSCGDFNRINWGYAYLAARDGDGKAAIGENRVLEEAFLKTGGVPASDDTRTPRACNDTEPVLAFAFDLGKVGAKTVQRQVIVAYDEIYAVNYFGRKLLPYWARNGAKIGELLATASRDYPKILARCEAFDNELTADLIKVGGEKYAALTTLAYRQCIAGCGLAADANKQPLFFAAENTSNGNMATVDVIFPMMPVWIFLSPSLAKASVVHVLMYSSTPRWKFPYAPHDLGDYPIAFGREVIGGITMPVEETGNMLLMCSAIAHAEGSADFVTPWWPLLTQWAQFLEQYGLDPGNQLCTDDFMGHLAHNANLSVKAILALAAYGDLCRMRGDEVNANKYVDLAKAGAENWVKVTDDGDHSRLAFDKPGTWSLKYNLVLDRLLGLNIFPPSVADKEIAYYKTMMQPYGVPLDSRTKRTKTDWLFWCATLAKNQTDFEALIAPSYKWFNVTTSRAPLPDYYPTDVPEGARFNARPVIGGLFIKMLSDRDLWKKWASRDKLKPSTWAPIAPPPKVATVVPLEQKWRYTTAKPSADWVKPGFDDSAWSEGQAAFGNVRGSAKHTELKTDDIWLRREITLPEETYRNLQFLVLHQTGAEIYVDGILALSKGWLPPPALMEIHAPARARLKPGAKVVLAVHCHQNKGDYGFDLGLSDVTEP